MESVLITGADGKIGDALRKALRGSYPLGSRTCRRARLAGFAPCKICKASPAAASAA
jgi:nucleoside-diphosphate-sugar epimerase